MSILNIANDGLFNITIILVRVLIRLGPRNRGSLLAACGAEVAQISPQRIGMTLTRWTELGLFSNEDNVVAIRESYRNILGSDADMAETRLPKVMRTIMMARENNDRFWEITENRSADFSRGLSWLLAQDIYTLDTGSYSKIEQVELIQVADASKRVFQNDVRWSGLRTWMIYLGFGRAGRTMVIDPTEAVRESLDDVFLSDNTLSAPDFLKRLADVLPVLDGGLYRRQVETVLKDSDWMAPPDDKLSTALSRALRRLAREGVIAFEQLSDFEDGFNLIGADQKPWLRMTHLHRTKRGGEA